MGRSSQKSAFNAEGQELTLKCVRWLEGDPNSRPRPDSNQDERTPFGERDNLRHTQARANWINESSQDLSGARNGPMRC